MFPTAKIIQKLYKTAKKYQKNRTFLKKNPKCLIFSIIFFVFFRLFANINKEFNPLMCSEHPI